MFLIFFVLESIVEVMKKIFISFIFLSLLLLPSVGFAEELHTTGIIEDFFSIEVDSEYNEELAHVTLKDGVLVEARYSGSENGNSFSEMFHIGQKVVVAGIDDGSGGYFYVVTDPYRIPALVGVLVGFFVLIFAVGRLRGLTSLLGLVISIAVIVLFIVPKIADGASPIFIGLIGSVIIALLSITTAHGLSRRTFVALGATLVTLCLAVFLSWLVVEVTSLFGLGNEDAYILQFGQFSNLNFKGLLFASIIIGALGVLDDVTAAQVAAVDEIYKANPKLSQKELLQSASSVGKEHFTSMINTLALAYAGASLPLLLTFSVSELPFWALLNGEMLAEELIRTIVGSACLILAVPISTRLAVQYLRGSKKQEIVDNPTS